VKTETDRLPQHATLTMNLLVAVCVDIEQQKEQDFIGNKQVIMRSRLELIYRVKLRGL
jgi:hypothetical protein